jgi:hypothetical protein
MQQETRQFASVTKSDVVACLLKARIVEPETRPLLGNSGVTCNNEITVGSGVLYAVRSDSYVVQQ